MRKKPKLAVPEIPTDIPSTSSNRVKTYTLDGKFDVSFLPKTNFDAIRELLSSGVDLLEMKNREYGDSWQRRGGVGAFFTVWRKIDRLEEQLKKAEYNMFDISVDADDGESIDETLKDALLYFALVLEKRQAFRKSRSVKTKD